MSWRPLPRPGGDKPEPLQASLDAFLRSLGAPPPEALTRIFGQWQELVGPGIGAASRPVRIDSGVLTVAVSDGAWASQLRWMEQALLAKLSEQLGDAAVTRLEVRVQPL